MPSNPSFQFYPGDYCRDTRLLSIAARGAWMDLICSLHWSQPRGKITVDIPALDRLWGTQTEHTRQLLKELQDRKVCDIVTDDHGNVTLTSRRITREENSKNSDRLRKQKQRVTEKSHESHTPSSSSSSKDFNSSDLKRVGANGSKTVNRRTRLPDDEWIKTLEESPAYTGIDIQKEFHKCLEWFKNKGIAVSRQRFLNWLNKTDKPLAEPDYGKVDYA